MLKSSSLGSHYQTLGRKNGLNMIRLVLAGMVIVSHAGPLTGRSAEVPEPFQHFGMWAVSGFFAISGYLISASAESNDRWKDFFKRRFLRIFPAFWVVLLVVGFVFAPLYSHFFLKGSDDYTFIDGLTYFLSNFTLVIADHSVGGTLSDAAYANAWNGSLWTLAPEFVCYTLIFVAYKVLKPGLRSKALAFGLAFATIAFFLVPDIRFLEEALRLGLFFIAGSLIHRLREKVHYSKALFILSVCLVLLTWTSSEYMVLVALPAGYALMWLGVMTKNIRIGQKNDISYGLYIYAFPVQQLIAGFDSELPLVGHVLMAFMFTSLLAWGSWHAIESPALRLLKKSQ